MLKIVERTEQEGTRLYLQGDVIGLWVEELQRSCEAARGAGPFTVDLRDVGFLDGAGVTLLRKLDEAGVRLVNASGFVVEQLKAPTR